MRRYTALIALALAALAAPGFARDGRDRGAQPPMPWAMGGNTRAEQRFAGGLRIFEATQMIPGGDRVHAIRYGNALTGVVEHPMKPGYSSRTYVQGGRVLYARVYRQNTFQRYGHAFSYERLVPGIAFDTAYYEWASRPWATPVNYQWQWNSEPWHRAYGSDFTPYANYSSLDQWLTDYVVAQNLRNAYDNCQAEKAPTQQQASTATGPRPYWDTPDDGQRPYWEEQPEEKAPPAQPAKSRKKPVSAPKSTAPQNRPSGEDAPPVLTGQVKAELNAQIKRQLAERQAPTPTTGADDLPDSLKPGHTLFRVNVPLDVPAKVSGQLCSLRANDYIERTGDMDQNGMVPVKVRVGGAFDCAIGLTTRVSVNDLEAMESEQQQALTDALLAASKNMGGGRGLPQAPATTPVLLAAGQATPTPNATRTLGQLQ